MSMRMLAGTTGYSYKEWVGHFYPAKLPADAMLRYYAERFPTVEINNTFYRMPAEAVLTRWAQQVPDGFAFTLKAPRRITHIKRLKEVESSVTEFTRRASLLGDKLGLLFFQLPPFMKKDVPRLKDLFAALPHGLRAVVEFRNPTWRDDEVYETLRACAGILCVSQTDESETPFLCTSDIAYLRLRRSHYDEADLRGWIDRIAAQPLSAAYIYFKHEEEALATRFATHFAQLWSARSTP